MNDLIKRQDAINALVEKGQSSKRYKLGEFWELNLSEIKEALDELPSAEAQPRWIPVTEALPEEDEDVLLLMAEGEMAVGQRRGVNYWDGYRRRAVIVAWMPLPEPWRGE